MKPSLRSKPISIFELKRSPTAVFEASECDAVAVYNRGALIGYVVPTQTYEQLVSRVQKLEAEVAHLRACENDEAA